MHNVRNDIMNLYYWEIVGDRKVLFCLPICFQEEGFSFNPIIFLNLNRKKKIFTL